MTEHIKVEKIIELLTDLEISEILSLSDKDLQRLELALRIKSLAAEHEFFMRNVR